MKKIKLKTVFTVLFCCLALSVKAYANSAPVQITSGDPARGVIPMDESLLTVEKEILTFDIEHLLPEENDYDTDGAADRSGTVCAQYFFKNPSAEEVTLKLAFAHGIERINSSCDVRLDGQPLETRIRYTYTGIPSDFYGPSDVRKIKDGFTEDSFFDPEMPVTEYVSRFDGLPDEGSDAVFEYIIPDGNNTRILIPCNYNESGDYKRKAGNGDCVSVYVIGDDDGVETSWSIGESREIIPETGRKMTLSEFASLTMEGRPGICETDSYNIVTEGMNAAMHSDLIFSYIPGKSFDTTMWIEYEFTIGPGESAVNEVKAVLAPEIAAFRKDPEYDYYYLLSPAQCWKEFGSLDVIINTPHKYYNYEKDGYEKTETGYIKHFEALPEGELHFCLTEGKSSPARSSEAEEQGTGLIGTVLIAALIIAASVFGLGILTVTVVIIINSRKRKNK